jgi:hypothetical protein
MALTHPEPRPFKTYLTPGQRFQCTDDTQSSLTVARLVKDRMGLLHVTLRADDGHEISAFAEQIEVAISEGHLSPLMSTTFATAVAC